MGALAFTETNQRDLQNSDRALAQPDGPCARPRAVVIRRGIYANPRQVGGHVGTMDDVRAQISSQVVSEALLFRVGPRWPLVLLRRSLGISSRISLKT
jgi:hypothetical protein